MGAFDQFSVSVEARRLERQVEVAVYAREVPDSSFPQRFACVVERKALVVDSDFGVEVIQRCGEAVEVLCPQVRG